MRLIEIKKTENGFHHNQNIDGRMAVPTGWAVIPEKIETPNFPYGELTAEEIDGVMTVTNWVPGIIPEPEPKPEAEPSAEELLDILLGVTE